MERAAYDRMRVLETSHWWFLGRRKVLSRLLALELPPLGSPRWPDATAPGGFAQLFRALILRRV